MIQLPLRHGESYVHNVKHILAGFVLFFSLVVGVCFWCSNAAPWLHPELLGTAAYVWISPDTENLLALFRKVFDWKAFDPNVNRVRPLNDFAEIVDAIARPYIAIIFGAHPSITPTAVLTALGAPVFLALYLRRSIGTWVAALLLCAIFVSSTGYLSVLIPYIRPAKKISLLLLCLCLWMAQRHSSTAHSRDYILMAAALLASFFADEVALANFVIIGTLFWKSIFRDSPAWKRRTYFALPILFLIITKWVIPKIYSRFSVHGAWDALADPKKFEVFGYIFDPTFHMSAAINLGRSILTSVGVSYHTPATELIALAVFFIPMLLVVWRYRRQPSEIGSDKVFLATIALYVTNTYVTLLDWYPFPNEVSYLGSFNYYYHSSIPILVILWIASFIQSDAFAYKKGFMQKYGHLIACVIVTAIVISNFVLFDRVNRLVQNIHTYPFSSKSLFGALKKAREELRSGSLKCIVFRKEESRLNQQFDADLYALFGDNVPSKGFAPVIKFVRETPIMSRDHIGHLVQAFFPKTKANLVVLEEAVQDLPETCRAQ